MAGLLLGVELQYGWKRTPCVFQLHCCKSFVGVEVSEVVVGEGISPFVVVAFYVFYVWYAGRCVGLVAQFHQDGCARPLLCVVVEDGERVALIVRQHGDVYWLCGIAGLLQS